MNFHYAKLIFFLREFMKRIFGEHYPTEIISYITLILYKPIKIYCGDGLTSIISNFSIYIFGALDQYDKEIPGNIIARNILNRFLPHNIKSIKHNRTHVLILTNKGEVYDHNLNLEPLMTNVKKIICKYDYTLALTKNNEIYHVYKMIPIISCDMILSDIKKISCSLNHIMILTKMGKLYGWNRPTHNDPIFSTAVQEIMNSVMLIDCGTLHTIVVTFRNKIYVWGSNFHGQLGLDNFLKHEYLPCELVLFEEGNKPLERNGPIEEPCEQSSRLGAPLTRFSLQGQDILSIKCGAIHTLLLTKNDQIYGWGSDQSGQLGSSHLICFTPHKISFSFMDKHIRKIYCGKYFTFVTTQEKIFVTGMNGPGQLGLDRRGTCYGFVELQQKIEI